MSMAECIGYAGSVIIRMYFKQKGIKRFVAGSGNAAHRKYLRRNGFKPDPERPDLFVKAL